MLAKFIQIPTPVVRCLPGDWGVLPVERVSRAITPRTALRIIMANVAPQLCRPININAAGVESCSAFEWSGQERGWLHFMHKLFMKFIVLNGQR